MTNNPNLSCFREPNWVNVAHISSASQIQTWELCNRKWWFDKGPLRLRELDRGYFTFGTVTHAVIERYLSADDLGNDPATGLPVDLYPPGWESTMGRDKKTLVSISIIEQETIKKLIPLAIEQGILVRSPGRLLEQKFYLPILQLDDGGVVWLMGYIDVMLSDEVQDHKTTSNMKYALSPAKLRASPQMLIYALVCIQRCAETGAPLPQKITLRHNVFGKDPMNPKLRKTSVEVTPTEVMEYLPTIKRICERMVGQLKIKEWSTVPGADESEQRGGCNAYGGCQFAPICTGQETPEKYMERVDRVERERLNSAQGSTEATTVTSTLRENNTVSINVFEQKLAERVAQKVALEAGGVPPASTIPALDGSQVAPGQSTTPVTPAAPIVPPAAPIINIAVVHAPALAPWGIPGCTVCHGGGFNASGNPCRICDSKQAQASRITSEMFVIEPMGDGTYVWETKPEYVELVNAATGTAALPPANAPVVQEAVALTTPPPAPDVEPGQRGPELIPEQTVVVWMYRNNPVTGVFTKYVKDGIQARRHTTGKNSKVNDGDYRLATPEEITALVTQIPATPAIPPVAPAVVPPVAPIASTATVVPPVAPTIPAPAVVPPAAPPADASKPVILQGMGEVVTPSRGPGRPPKGFTLCVNCLPSKGGNGSVVYLDDVMQRYGEKLATSQGVNSFYMLDDFKRRNALGYAAPTMAEEFGTNIVVVRGHNQDIRALTDALRPLADVIFEGLLG